MSDFNSLRLINNYNFVIHEGLGTRVIEFQFEDIINHDWADQPNPRLNYVTNYFQEQKNNNGGLTYLRLDVHYKDELKRAIFKAQLNKQLVERLYRGLPHPFLTFSGHVESLPSLANPQEPMYKGSIKGGGHIREWITCGSWRDNCDFHNTEFNTSLVAFNHNAGPVAPPHTPRGGMGRSSAPAPSGYQVSFNLSVGLSEHFKIKNIQISPQYFMEKLFENEVTKDLIIVAGNGAEIKCHAIIFSAHCPAFSRMLSSQTPMREAISGRFEMSENSEVGVQTLIKYLYGMQMIIEDLSVDVAVELFQTAHKYDLSQLEGALLHLFMKMDVDWFTPDAILELYLFVKQLDCLNYLRAHCLLLMTSMDIRDFRACEEFKKLDALQSTDVLVEMVDCLKKRVPKTDQRGVKRKGEED